MCRSRLEFTLGDERLTCQEVRPVWLSSLASCFGKQEPIPCQVSFLQSMAMHMDNRIVYMDRGRAIALMCSMHCHDAKVIGVCVQAKQTQVLIDQHISSDLLARAVFLRESDARALLEACLSPAQLQDWFSPGLQGADADACVCRTAAILCWTACICSPVCSPPG